MKNIILHTAKLWGARFVIVLIGYLGIQTCYYLILEDQGINPGASRILGIITTILVILSYYTGRRYGRHWPGAKN